MIHGNIYPPEQVDQALSRYFRTDNLTALRELTLRFLADETEDQLLDYLRGQRKDVVWETHERILVAVTTAPGTDAIVRRAARMAARIKAELQVLHVMTGNEPGRRPSDELVALRQLAGDVGASWNEIRGDDPAQVLIDFARREHITQIVVGSSGRTRWQELRGGGSIIRKITRLAAPAGIDIHVIARRHEILPDSSVTAVDES
jgi:two-component system sensor histidine kinase KdpD